MFSRLKILMIEDSATDAEIVQRMLKKEYPQVQFRLCMTETTFLANLEQFKPDIILADNSLPEFNATRALLLLQQQPDPVPFILVTGTVSEEFAAGIIKLGASDYILKDRLGRLPSAIEAALRQWRAEQANETARKLLVQSEENLKAIFENTSEGFILVDTEGTIKAFNKRAGENILFATEANIADGKSIFDYIEAGRQDHFKMVIEKIREGVTIQYDRHYINPGGEKVWVNLAFNPVRMGHAVTGICITGRNITAARIAEEQKEADRVHLQALAERMTGILNTLPANIALLDAAGNIMEVNEAWKKFADGNGYAGKNYCIGDNYLTISTQQYRKHKHDGNAVAKGINSVLKREVDEFVFEYPCHSQGIKRWFRMVVTPLQETARGGAVVMHIDISELRRLEQERLESRMDEQKKIARTMLHAQEKERNQLGQELHDNISQLLAAIKMKMGYFINDPENNMPVINACQDHIQEVIEEARNLSHRMVLPRFTENNFSKAIRQLAAKYEDVKRKIEVSIDGLDEEIMASGIKETLYRIVQEQLNNIEKYAKADFVNIRISTREAHFVMEIKDNGIGFDKKEKRNGIGLNNIFNRAESYNGSAAIDTSPGNGCTLTVAIPAGD